MMKKENDDENNSNIDSNFYNDKYAVVDDDYDSDVDDGVSEDVDDN